MYIIITFNNKLKYTAKIFILVVSILYLHTFFRLAHSETSGEAIFGKNPSGYIKPIKATQEEIDKEKAKLKKLKEKENSRIERIKNFKKNHAEKTAEALAGTSKGIIKYTVGDKAGAAIEAAESEKAYFDTKSLELQNVSDLTKTFKPDIRASEKKIKGLQNFKDALEKTKLELEQEIAIKEQLERERIQKELNEKLAREKAAREKAAREKIEHERESKEKIENFFIEHPDISSERVRIDSVERLHKMD